MSKRVLDKPIHFFPSVGKKGVSAVVATVLIIMITVSAVAILWATVIPMIKNSLGPLNSEGVQLKIITSEGYTFYDSEAKVLYLQVQRGPDNLEVKELQVIYTINGSSETLIINNTDYIPQPNAVRTIILPVSGKPEEISVVPIWLKEKSLINGNSFSVNNIFESGSLNPTEQGDYTPSKYPNGDVVVDEEGDQFILPIYTFIQATDTHIHVGGNPLPSAADGRTDNCIRGLQIPQFPDLYDQYCEEDRGSKLPTIAWTAAVEKINNLPGVDFTVITGDIVAQASLDGNKTNSLDKFKEISDNLDREYYVVGAYFHDAVQFDENENAFVERFGPLNWNFTKGNNLFVGVSQDYYFRDDKNLTDLKNLLDDYKDDEMTLFVFSHFLGGYTDNGEVEIKMSGEIEDIGEILENYSKGDYPNNFKKIIVIQGHFHSNMYSTKNGVHYIHTTSTMNYPTEFRIFDIYQDKVEVRMSDIISPEVNAASEEMVDWYIENNLLSRADPEKNKTGLAGLESERTITISLE